MKDWKIKKIKTLHGELKLPAFFPDATRGFIKCLSDEDLVKTNSAGVVVNAYHLLKENKIKKIKQKKGIHNFMNFKKIILSDSGGFQVMSLIHRNPELGEILDDKVIFNLDGKKINFTPEKCIKTQIEIGSDIIMCLDECTHSEKNFQKQKQSVLRTIAWAKKCKKEFEKLTEKKKRKPLIFAIVQGGNYKSLRKLCAKELIKIGFDGYAFGGWPVKNKKLLKGILKYTAELLPDDKIKYCMGVGKPNDILECVKFGYNLFDCVIPTRDARHKRIYVFTGTSTTNKYFSIKKKIKNPKKRISKFCNCELCKNYSFEKIYKMFKEKNQNAQRLASIHNLVFYKTFMNRLDKSLNEKNM